MIFYVKLNYFTKFQPSNERNSFFDSLIEWGLNPLKFCKLPWQNNLKSLKPYFYGFSKTLKVSFPRDQLWSRGKETLFQYRSKVYLYRQYLYGTETKFLFLEIKVGPEEKKLLRFLKNRKNTVLSLFISRVLSVQSDLTTVY